MSVTTRSDPAFRAFQRGLIGVLAEPHRIGMAFQPIVRLADGAVVGCEGLARFYAQPRATPDRWFAAAEELALDEQLEARALTRLLRMRAALASGSVLHVNVGLPAAASSLVQAAFARAGDLDGVVLELDRRDVLADPAAAAAATAPMRALGAEVAIDNAGAGFQTALEIGPEFVKIDRALVAGIDTDPGKAQIVAMIAQRARESNSTVIAAGVERETQLAELVMLGVPLAQGFLLGAPTPAVPAPGAAVDVAKLLGSGKPDPVRAPRSLAADDACASLPAHATRATIAQTFMADPATTLIALVDPRGRAVSLVTRQAFVSGEGPIPA